jgi:MshEN domain
MALEQWLIEEELISSEQLTQVRAHQAEAGLTLQMAVLDLHLIDEGSLVDLIARKNKLPKAPGPLHRIKVSPKAVCSIPQDLCWQNAIFPFGIDRGSKRLQLAVVDPKGFDLASLGGLAEYSIDLFIIGPKQLEKAIRKHYLDSMVDDTGAPKKRRFFGYDEITDPGLSPKLGSVAPPRPERPTPPPLDALPNLGSDLKANAVEASTVRGDPNDSEAGVKESKTPSGTGEVPLPEPALDSLQAARAPLQTRQGRSSLPSRNGPIKSVPTPIAALEGKPLKRTLTPVAVDGEEYSEAARQSAIGAIPTVPKPVSAKQLDDHKKRTRPPTADPLKIISGRLHLLEHVVTQLVDLIANSELPEQTRERAHQIAARLRTSRSDQEPF